MERRTPITYEQAGTLRDALAAAIALEGFHRQCRRLSMANLAQIVNVRIVCAGAPGQARGQLLTADHPAAGNSAAQPDAVAPVALAMARDGDDGWRVDLPPHSVATVVIRAS